MKFIFLAILLAIVISSIHSKTMRIWDPYYFIQNNPTAYCLFVDEDELYVGIDCPDYIKELYPHYNEEVRDVNTHFVDKSWIFGREYSVGTILYIRSEPNKVKRQLGLGSVVLVSVISAAYQHYRTNGDYNNDLLLLDKVINFFICEKSFRSFC